MEVKSSSKMNAERCDLVFNALRGKRTDRTFSGIKVIKEDFDEDDLTDSIVLTRSVNQIQQLGMIRK